MSTVKSKIVRIDNIVEHGNADSLEIAVIGGWECVVRKDQFQPGDKCLYIPIDSCIPPELEEVLFKGAKITLKRGRIKTIRIRGRISQGLVVNLNNVDLKSTRVGYDATEELGITKYEPPAPKFSVQSKNRFNYRPANPNFSKYTDLENIKNHMTVFSEDDDIVATEKIHGTNFRAGYVKYETVSAWDGVKKLTSYIRKSKKKLRPKFWKEVWSHFAGKIVPIIIKNMKARFKTVPEYEFVFGSHNIQLQHNPLQPIYFDTNVYAKMVKEYDLENRIPLNVVIYGEIYGDKIQKNYSYGCKSNEHKMVIFDVQCDGKYLSHDEMVAACATMTLPCAPVVYRGKFDYSHLKSLTLGNSILHPEQKIREGLVIRSDNETLSSRLGRKVLKMISDDYLLKDNTDFH